jgi:hypothetical protein
MEETFVQALDLVQVGRRPAAELIATARFVVFTSASTTDRKF